MVWRLCKRVQLSRLLVHQLLVSKKTVIVDQSESWGLLFFLVSLGLGRLFHILRYAVQVVVDEVFHGI